jgi:hypothetical protein
VAARGACKPVRFGLSANSPSRLGAIYATVLCPANCRTKVLKLVGAAHCTLVDGGRGIGEYGVACIGRREPCLRVGAGIFRCHALRVAPCPEGVVSPAARWWLLSFWRAEEHRPQRQASAIRPRARAARGPARAPLDRKSGSAACLLIARGSHDRQAGGHSRFARAEQRSATTTSSAAKPSTPTATGAGSSTSSNVSATKSSSNPYPQSHNAASAQPVLAGIARSQWPASIVQTAARAAEEVINLRHISVTARPARCRSRERGRHARALVVVPSIGDLSGDAGYPAPRQSGRRKLIGDR